MQMVSMIILSGVLLVTNSFGMELQLQHHVEKLSVINHEILEAFGYDSFDTCKKIIDKNPALVNMWYTPRSGDPCTLLHIAAEGNNIPGARALLESKALSDVPTQKKNYMPLHMARSKGMAKLLLHHGASLESSDWKGATPLWHVLFYRTEYSGIYDISRFKEDQRCDLAHYLLKRGANSNALVDCRGNTLLHKAVNTNFSSIVTFLLERNANTENKNIEGETPIEGGIFNYEYRFRVVKAFVNKNIFFFQEHCCIDALMWLKDGAKNFKNFLFSNATELQKIKIEQLLAELFMVVERGNNDGFFGDKIIKYGNGYLFKNASFTDLENWVGKEAIDYVKYHLDNRCQQVLCAAQNGDDKKLREIVNYYPFVLAYDKNKVFQLLECMMMSGDIKNLIYSLSENPDLSGVSEINRDTLLHKAVRSKNAQVIALLIKNGITLTAANDYKETSIDILYKIGDKDCIDSFYDAFADKFFSTYSYQAYYQEIKKILKDPKFNINLCDKDGKALLHRAVESYSEKCSLLLKHHAIVTPIIIESACSEEVRAELQEEYDKQDGK